MEIYGGPGREIHVFYISALSGITLAILCCNTLKHFSISWINQMKNISCFFFIVATLILNNVATMDFYLQ
jgi:hypothetical protein